MTALKGFGWGDKTARGAKRLQALNPKWYYAWRSRYTSIPDGFIPMIRDAGDLDENAISYIKSQLPKTKAPALLGFNEPDLKGQSDMSVFDALRLWPQLESTGLRLGAPAPAKTTDSPWLEEFMLKAERHRRRVDFMTMHSYGGPNSESFLKKVTALHEKYDRPVWVTEFAVADWEATRSDPNHYSQARVNAFMAEAVAGMREMPFVERLAWKTRAASDRNMGSSALFHTNGALTSTGRLYASL